MDIEVSLTFFIFGFLVVAGSGYGTIEWNWAENMRKENTDHSVCTACGFCYGACQRKRYPLLFEHISCGSVNAIVRWLRTYSSCLGLPLE